MLIIAGNRDCRLKVISAIRNLQGQYLEKYNIYYNDRKSCMSCYIILLCMAFDPKAQ